jgi:peptidyl-prolyl cis-trans isomerase A (cyclophilin A)
MQVLAWYYLGYILSCKHPQKKNCLMMFFKSKPIVFASTLCVLLSLNVQSTIVEIRTSLGTIEVNLFDNTTPKTVANFLTYVDSGAYANNVVHRSISDFVVQGGGFQYTGPVSLSASNQFTLDPVEVGQSVVNEPKLSNVRGTIAMAKRANDPNSATSQWFINLKDNSGGSAKLDSSNGGFTVFGQVMGNGMDVVDAIAALKVLGGANDFVFKEIPLKNYTAEDINNEADLTDDHFVVISDIVATDRAADTAANLNPAANTLINSSNGEGESSSGGAIGWLLLLGLAMLQINRLFKR